MLKSIELSENVKARGGTEALSDFLAELRRDGCGSRVVGKVLERIRAERVAAEASAARTFFGDTPSEPLSFLQLADELRELKHRAVSLELAMVGLGSETKADDRARALIFHAAELSRALARFEKAFVAELETLGRIDNPNVEA